MQRHHALPGLAMCWAVALACDSAARSDFAWNGSVSEANGHPVTTNPPTPALPPGTIRATALWRAPADDVADWAEPSKVVHGAGRYFVIDRRSTRVHIVGSDGQLVKSFGKH